MSGPNATASGMQTATIKTMIRCRPLPPGKKLVVEPDAARQGSLSISHPTRNVEQEFEFDALFPGETSQEKVRPARSVQSVAAGNYPARIAIDVWLRNVLTTRLGLALQVFDDACKPLVEHVLDGYNSCCFAYGQTGSGKTYSIFGEAEDTRRGIVPRAMEQVFVQLAKRTPYTKVSLYVSFVEIYMEKLRYAPDGGLLPTFACLPNVCPSAAATWACRTLHPRARRPRLAQRRR